MKKIIYADNFRGFDETYVTLSTTSFFVGQNSSGKSSLLALSHLLMDREFWLKPDFSSTNHDFGLFSDLVSMTSKDKSRFTIGCLASKKQKGGNKIFCGVLTFESFDDVPVINKCTFALGGRLISYGFSEKGDICRWLETTPEEKIDSNEESMKKVVLAHQNFDPNNDSSQKVKVWSRQHSLVSVALAATNSEDEGDFDAYQNIYDATSVIEPGAWFAPIRAEPSRFYQPRGNYEFSPSGHHTPFLLKEILSRKKRGAKPKFEKAVSSMIKVIGAESGLFDDVKIKKHGKGEGAPFSLSIGMDGYDFPLGEVGYGVSQVLPLIVEMLASSVNAFYIQQPEVHLHPKAQAGFSNLLYIYASKFPSSTLAIETHSDFIIDRYKSLCRESYLDLKKDFSSSIYWFERKDGKNSVYQITIGKDGDLPDDVPEGYREFFISEGLRGLGLDVDN